MTVAPPDYPAGPVSLVGQYDAVQKNELIQSIAELPNKLREAVNELTDEQLDVQYKNWSIRQITHHLADSHVHVYIRFKWTLTENNPRIKAYEEADWVLLDDCKTGAIEPSLMLLDGLHAKWVQLLQTLTKEDFEKTFVHPQTNDTVSLWKALNYYPWHGRHHTAQILWVREHRGW